jgi:hypothetical protein
VDTGQVEELAFALGRAPDAPDVDETLVPALETIPAPDSWTLDQDKRLLVLSSDLLYVASVEGQGVDVAMFPVSRDDLVRIKVAFGPRGPLDEGASHRREWSFDFGERRGDIRLEGRERTMDPAWQDQVEQFARKLEERLGWPGLPIIEDAD